MWGKDCLINNSDSNPCEYNYIEHRIVRICTLTKVLKNLGTLSLTPRPPSRVRDTYFDFRLILDPSKVRKNLNKRVRDKI